MSRSLCSMLVAIARTEQLLEVGDRAARNEAAENLRFERSGDGRLVRTRDDAGVYEMGGRGHARSMISGLRRSSFSLHHVISRLPASRRTTSRSASSTVSFTPRVAQYLPGFREHILVDIQCCPDARNQYSLTEQASGITTHPVESDDTIHSPLLRRARRAATVDPRLHRPRARAARAAVGGRALVPRRGRSRSSPRQGLLGAEVPGVLRRAGRRLPARGGAVRGDGARRLRAARPRASARTSTSPRRRSGSSAPRSRSSATSCRRSAARRSARSASPSRAPALTSPRITTRAERVDGGWVVNGEKTYITNGVRAHFIVTAVKTTAGGRPPRHLVPDRRPRRGRQLLEAREARLARLGHRHDQLPGRVRARGEPARAS